MMEGAEAAAKRRRSQIDLAFAAHQERTTMYGRGAAALENLQLELPRTSALAVTYTSTPIPETFFSRTLQLDCLRELSLAECFLDALPPQVLSLQLSVLDVRGNRLTRLPASLGTDLGQLRVLRLDRNRLESLPSSLLELAHLERISLLGNHLLPMDLLVRCRTFRSTQRVLERVARFCSGLDACRRSVDELSRALLRASNLPAELRVAVAQQLWETRRDPDWQSDLSRPRPASPPRLDGTLFHADLSDDENQFGNVLMVRIHGPQ